MLGKDVVAELALEDSWNLHIIVRHEAPWVPGTQIVADLLDTPAITALLQDVRPTLVVHCAALTDIERCERDRKTAYLQNVETVRTLTRFMPKAGRFVYVSTDSVFDGERGNYTENDAPCPLNYYAESKLLGERAALSGSDNALIVRTNIYGFHIPIGKSLVEWAIGNLESGRSIAGFYDMMFNPLYSRQVAKILRRLLIRNDVSGILNLGVKEQVSKYEFLQLLAGIFGYRPELIAKASSLDGQLPVRRPRNTTLDCSRLRDILLHTPSIHDGMSELKRDYASVSEKEYLYERNKNWQSAHR
jgi:dTDP-4-dehydrorhamnose reductase